MLRGKFLGIILVAGMLISQSVPSALAATDCDHAQFVSDLTAPDGSTFAPGATFTKTWRLTNIGTCGWTTAYNVVWAGGDSAGAPLSIKLPADVPPGQMVDVSVNLTAPTTGGHYKSLFKISNQSGIQFGIGASASDPFWVDFNVVDASAVIYDFLANAPYAQWKSGAGVLPFPGTSGDSRGFAYQMNIPHLEDDSFDSSPGLFVVPQNKFNGYLQATYPEFQVQQSDHLQTLVNCEFGATSCYVTFRIDYLLSNGVQKTLWSWKEAYDKRFYRANLDLSSLAGQKVRFVFMLLSTGFAGGDRAIWGSPRIVRSGTTQPPAPPPTLTPLPPLPATATPLGQPPPTTQPAGCDKAAFVTDVTVPDGTSFTPGAAFTKTWRLKNIGSCNWTTSYKLVYYSGEQMSSPTTVNLPWGAGFDQTVDISVNMVAPSTAGKYRGYWILTNPSGQFFGIGSDASKPVWVDINVSGDAPYEGGYQLWSNACSAEWKSGSGPLPCPGVEGNSKGFIIPLNYSHLEDGTMGPLPTLLMSPENKFNGYIQGIFPAFTVQPRDHFVTGTGCEYGYNCYVTFRLDYMTANGGIFNFWSWREQNDKKNYTANVDLSPLAGRSVRFILTILATGSATGDRVRWGGPTIVRVEGTTPPATTAVPPTANWPAYINSTYGFNFKYPPGSERFFETNNSILIKMPITPGTNLAEKYLQMSVGENVSPCQSPLSNTSPPGSPTETVVFNGIPFFKQIGGDAGMSQVHEWVGYSTVKNNACISMDFVLHSVNGSYPPPPDFDKAAESAVFTQVMSTFAWNAPPSPTPTQTPTPTNTPAPPTVAPPPGVSSPQINKLFMIDASSGWAIGNSYVLRTTNGGATWNNVSLSIAGLSSVKNGFFQNGSKGWVIATTLTDVERTSLFRTTNGGITWTTYTIPFNGGYMQFLNDTNGFVLAGEGIGMQKQPVSLYQTSDGGATWTLKFAHDPNQPTYDLPVSGHKNGMAFRDTSRGWIGGDLPVSGSVYLYRTDNGGVTWSEQPLALPTGYESAGTTTTAPIFFSPNDAVLPVWTITSAGKELFIYVSHDGGMTWSPSSSSAPASYGAEFVSVRDVFSVGETSLLHVTHDSGMSWSQITPNISLGDGIPQLDFVSTNLGWALSINLNGKSSLYRTADGGATWTQLFGQPPVTQVLPDLTIGGMYFQLQNPSCLMPGDLMGVRVGIANNGQAAAGSFVVRVNNVDQTVNGLGVGETTVLFFPGNGNPVTAIADVAGTVSESDENNNTRSEMVPVPTPPLPCNNPAEFVQTIVNRLNARNFDAVKVLMDQQFLFGYWQSQGTSYTPDLAIESLKSNLNTSTPLISDPNKDLTALLGGSNPYTIMGLDPAKSQALFVSGWGSDGTSEAILYVTRRTDGSLYFPSVLIAPGGFARFATSTPAPLQGPYAVVGVAPSDVLNIRAGAGPFFQVVGSFPRDATNVMKTGQTAAAEGAEWVEVQRPDGGLGWVNSTYLTEYVSTAAFCADTHIPQLIEQLKQSMIQSNGDQFASLIGSKHGATMNFWRNVPPINYTAATARGIFTDPASYNWGTGPAAGSTSDTGTFAQIVQPDMVDVFNSGYQLGCDNPSYASMFVDPWPNTNIHYYSILKPPSSAVFDWKVWLVGFEYVGGQPYLYGTVHYVWDP